MTLHFIPLKGRLDASSSTAEQTRIEQSLDAIDPRPSHVIFGLEEVTYLSSAGLRLFLVVHRRCVAQKGSLVLTGVPRPVKEVLQVAGLDDAFPIFADEAEARKRLG